MEAQRAKGLAHSQQQEVHDGGVIHPRGLCSWFLPFALTGGCSGHCNSGRSVKAAGMGKAPSLQRTSPSSCCLFQSFLFFPPFCLSRASRNVVISLDQKVSLGHPLMALLALSPCIAQAQCFLYPASPVPAAVCPFLATNWRQQRVLDLRH